MSTPNQPFDPRLGASRRQGSVQVLGRAYSEPAAGRWPLAARASLVMSLCGLFWGVLGAAVLHIASH